MANTQILIKRSNTDAVSANVDFGELAYTANGDILYIGDRSNTAVAIAGKRTPGTLTANQALVADANGYIDVIKADEIVAGNVAVNTLSEQYDIPVTSKIDVMWKLLGFNKARTDGVSAKLAGDETIVSNIIIAPSDIWTDAGSIPSTKPGTNSAIVLLYSEFETTEDATSTADRTWLTALTNWIPPRYGTSYTANVYIDTTGSGNPAANGVQIPSTGTAGKGEWYMDYQAGTLHFIGLELPPELTGANTVFITAARYDGDVGFTGAVLTNSELVNATITSLSAPLATAYGGTGVSAFTPNTVFTASNSSAIGFRGGANGQIMIVTNNDVSFEDLDGGTY